MKSSCESCNRPFESVTDARVCSYDCTFCANCAAEMNGRCPNCGGELEKLGAA